MLGNSFNIENNKRGNLETDHYIVLFSVRALETKEVSLDFKQSTLQYFLCWFVQLTTLEQQQNI